MKVLIAGGNGQLGWELQRTVPAGVHPALFDLPELDITDAAAVQAVMQAEQPDAVINAAAYTAVDRAEGDAERALAVNAAGAEHLATAARARRIPLVHISTDFIFDGRANSPYRPDAEPNPLSVYGSSKWEGERRVRQVLGDSGTIIRTAWVYSSHGHNFVKTMLRLMSERDELGVIADQIGTPTWANSLASAVWAALDRRATGVLHWTDAGAASWYDFAVAIQEEALAMGLLTKQASVKPLRTDQYPTPAIRPAYSVLDKTDSYRALGMQAVHWRVQLRGMLADLAAGTT